MTQNNNITEMMNGYLSTETVIRQPSIQFPITLPNYTYTYYIPFGLYDDKTQGFKFKINKHCNLKCGVLLSNGNTVFTDDFNCPENTEIIFNNEFGASGGPDPNPVSSIINLDNDNTTFATPFITFNQTQTQTQIISISSYVESN